MWYMQINFENAVPDIPIEGGLVMSELICDRYDISFKLLTGTVMYTSLSQKIVYL